MKKTRHITRLLALLLTLCTLVGLLPSVVIPGVKAEESTKAETRAIADETNALISTLTTSYNSFTIPANKEVTNYTTLDGVYFFRESGSGRTINFANARSQHKDRLTANSNSGTAAGNYYHLNSIGATGTNGGAVTAINGSTPNNLYYAVEIKKYTSKITWDTTTKYTDTSTNKTYTGWSGYINWEYNRSNAWSGDKKYGEYVGINGLPKTSDPVYSIKSLHPNRASAPYLATNNGSGNMNYTAGAFPWFLKVNSTNASVKIYKIDPTGGTRYTYWLGIDTQNSNYVSGHTLSQIVREDRNLYASKLDKLKNCNKKGFKFEYWDIFQVSPVSLELYRALEKAKPYVTGKNAEGKYPAETYLGFLKFVQSAMATYNSKKNVWSTDKNHADRINLDAIAKDLRSYMALLDIESKPGTYMDIPMEVLDFRADGLMFEDWNSATPYSLATDRPTVSAAPGSTPVFPGTNGIGENGSGYVTGLIEPQLKKGQILYTEEAVTYIANALFWQYHAFSDPRASSTDWRGDFAADDMDAFYNKVFMKMADPNTGNRVQANVSVDSLPTGSYEETINKTDTKENGGILPFSQVETCFDLAYYMMTNIWRETSKDDIVETVTKGSTTFNLPYNLKVNELHTMRLLKDSSGNYVYSSDKENGRNLDSGLIFNYSLTANAPTTYPTLNAVAELGFESTSMLGNNSTGGRENPSGDIYGKRNYHVMYHMRSSFIYYEEKNLNFSFTGDDDVYFFINNQLVCDIGGMHSATQRSIQLNGAVADNLGLEDGDICTFDMFLAERHTAGINLNLKTNIEMMPVGVATDKVQYEYTQAGVIGKEIREGGVVADRTEVGYGFKLLNRCEYGATDLTFTDDNLSVSLSGDALSLGDRANAEDLILIYRTYDPQSNTIYAGEPALREYGSFYSQLSKAVADMSSIVPMDEGAYKLTGLTEEQIMKLLKLGLPASVQISIYGFHQTVYSSVGGYTNVVYTTCRPISYANEDGTFAYEDPINGFATRNLNVQTMNTVTAEPLQIVIDYGKPVTVTESEILKCVTYDPLDVQISFKGIRTEGNHGAIVFREPAELFLQGEGEELKTDNGVYDRNFGSVRFTPKGMLEEIERVYALVCVNDVYLGSSWYLTVAIEIIPATLVYYEAEDLAKAGELNFLEKWTEEVVLEPTESETEETEPTEAESTESDPTETDYAEEEEEPEEELPTETPTEDDGVRTNTQMPHVLDTEDREHPVSTYDQKADYLYFGFDNTAADRYRYTDPIYGCTYNFDKTPSYGDAWIYTSSRTPGLTVSDGAMVVTCGEAGSVDRNSPWLQTGGIDVTKALNYPASRAEKAWVRLKLSNMTTDIDPQYDLEEAVARLAFVVNDDATMEDSACWVDFPLSEEQLNASDYMTLSADITGLLADHEAKRITAVRLTIINAAGQPGKTGTFWIDEIYVGPRVAQDTDNYIAPTGTVLLTAPEKESYDPTYDSSVLYFGFGNSAADTLRYTSNSVYKRNFDTAGSWFGVSGRTIGIGDGALNFTGGSGNNSWTHFSTGTSDADLTSLNFQPGANDWFEVRIKVNDLTPLKNRTRIDFDLELCKDATYRYKISCPKPIVAESGSMRTDTYYTITFQMPENSGGWANCIPYKDLGTVKRLVFLPTGLNSNSIFKCSVDYIYIGPEEKLPSKENGEHLYFGFDNDRAAQYKYGSTIYGGTNFDLIGNWRYGRFTDPKISGGIMSYTLNADAYHWFETQRNGAINNCVLDYSHTKEDAVQVRLRFNQVEMYNNATHLRLSALFAYSALNEPSGNYSKAIDIPASEVSTDGKWFTYSIPLGDALNGIGNVTGIRLNFDQVTSSDGKGSIDIEYIYVGPALNKEPEEYRRDEDYTYGWDSAYVKDSLFSDNESLYLEGRGVPTSNEDDTVNYDQATEYSEVSFSFTGTGFDLIGRTGTQQGTVRAAVYKKVADTSGTKDVFVKAITVNAKGELELYQIPVVSIQGLEHDTYYVKLWFNDKVIPPQIPGVDLSYLARGNQFYIDAIRIYDPIDVSAEAPTGDALVALEAYKIDGEAYNYIKEIRNILLSKETFDNLGGTLDGAIFVDMETTPTEIIEVTDADGETTGETIVETPDGIEVENHITAKVETYNKIGPKNEVYLAPGQAIAFRLAVDSVQPIASLDVGAKTIEANSHGKLSIGFVVGTDTVEGEENFDLSTATAQYYAVDAVNIRSLTTDSGKEIYFVIYNATDGDKGENVISVTDVKVAYEDHPHIQPPEDSVGDTEIKQRSPGETAPVRFLVDGNAAQAAATFVRALAETPVDGPTDDPTGDITDKETIVDESVRILHSLNLASDISINYVVPKTELEGYEDIIMTCSLPVYEGNSFMVKREITLMPEEKGDYLYFTLTGMTAVNMNDTVEAVLFMTKDGKSYTTAVDTYSIAQYAYAQLGKDYIQVELKALCADLLRYGGEAQRYKGYRTDSLADSAMTEEYKGYLTDPETVTFDSINTTTGDVEGSAVRWAGKALLLDSKVTIRYIVDLNNYTDALSDLSLVVSYRDLDGVEQTVTLRDPALYNEDLHYYSFDFDGLLAAELRQTVSATVYVGTEAATGTLQYTASTYGSNKTGALGFLCKCLMAYSDSAKIYFTK